MLENHQTAQTDPQDLEGKQLFTNQGRIQIVRDASIPPVSPFMPQFDIQLDGQKIGYISRGHSFVQPEFRRKGHFLEAMKLLEQFERGLFQQGKYLEYRQAIANHVGAFRHVLAPFFMRLERPHHIDCFAIPDVAAWFVEHGYQLDRWSKEYLLAHKMAEDFSPEAIAAALRKNALQLKGQMMCLLYKEVVLDPP